MSGLVGAYCAAPADLAALPDREKAWYTALAAEDAISGLELPFADTVHPRGAAHLGSLLKPGWRNVLSDIPGTDRKSRADGRYGLASEDEFGRAAALADARALRETALALGPSVVAVELHSAPTGGTAQALTRSLAEIAQWDWGSAALCLEHVDALVAGHPAEKGYLSLTEEIRAATAATESTGTRILHSVNWGRSAIEGRSADTPLEHVRSLLRAGLLGGVVLSGAAATGPDRWRDAHLGMREEEPDSVLGLAELVAIRRAVADTGLLFFGAKMRAPVGLAGDAPFAQRIAPSLAALARLDTAAAAG